MTKKILSMLRCIVICLSCFCTVACASQFNLDEYKETKKTLIDEAVSAKEIEAYSTERWTELLEIANTGKQAVDEAIDKAEADSACESTLQAIDEVKMINQEDYVVTISAENSVKKLGEDFVVEVCLLNQSGKDITISFYYSPFEPKIANWGYPFPVLSFPPTPDEIELANGNTYSETWTLGSYGYYDPVTKTTQSLPVGEHELHFIARIQSNPTRIVYLSNTIILTVVE